MSSFGRLTKLQGKNKQRKWRGSSRTASRCTGQGWRMVAARCFEEGECMKWVLHGFAMFCSLICELFFLLMVLVAWIQDNFDKVQNVQNFKGKYRRDVGSHSISGTLYWCKAPKLMSDNDTLLSVYVLGLFFCGNEWWRIRDEPNEIYDCKSHASKSLKFSLLGKPEPGILQYKHSRTWGPAGRRPGGRTATKNKKTKYIIT